MNLLFRMGFKLQRWAQGLSFVPYELLDTVFKVNVSRKDDCQFLDPGTETALENMQVISFNLTIAIDLGKVAIDGEVFIFDTIF